jgi:hypothetical protein
MNKIEQDIINMLQVIEGRYTHAIDNLILYDQTHALCTNQSLSFLHVCLQKEIINSIEFKAETNISCLIKYLFIRLFTPFDDAKNSLKKFGEIMFDNVNGGILYRPSQDVKLGYQDAFLTPYPLIKFHERSAWETYVTQQC